MGVTPQGPVEANRGVRARICAAEKALEGHDRQTHKQIYGNYRIDYQLFSRSVGQSINKSINKASNQ